MDKNAKTYTVSIKTHKKNVCMRYSSLKFKADSPLEAARKAHDYCAFGGPYRDMGWIARSKMIFFAVKERGTPRGTGITIVENRDLM